jgi:predicted aspartyl protease
MMALAAALLTALAAQQSLVIPPATLDDSLDVVGDPLAARQVKARMLVDVRVEGQGPFRFLVDSGADRSVVGAGLARALALPAAGTATLQSVAGTSAVATVRITGIVAPALAEANLGAQGVLGIDALADQRLMFDYDKRTVTVQDTRRAAPVDADEIVVTARRRKGQLILTQARIGATPISAVVDTGAEVTMGNMALLERLYRARRPPPVRPITLVSVTGQSIVANLVTLREMRIGGVILQNVEVAFADVPPFRLFGLDRQPAILLGSDVLQAFRRVSLDFHDRRIRFVLRR